MAELDALLADACVRYRERTATVDDEEALTYRELATIGGGIAEELRRGGIAPAEPVLVAVSNRGRDLAAFLGVWQAGGVIVPVHRTSVAEAAGRTALRTQARFVVNARPELPAPPAVATHAPVVRRDLPPPPERPLLHGAALVVYSSGTTGEPKGAVIGHARFAAKLDMIDGMLGFEAGVHTLLVLQLTFSFAQWVSLLTLAKGGTLTMRSRFDPAAVLHTLGEGRIDRVAFVPTMLRALAPLAAAGATRPFRGTVMAGGEVLPAAVGRQTLALWPQARLWDVFGLTETGTCDFFVRPEEYADAAGSIGRPGPGIAHRFGPDGELRIRTPWAMLGYLDAPELTADSFEDGHFRTGDLAHERADGRVELIGRAKELIIRAGNKISPLEVERAVLDHPDVAAALATGLADPLTGEAVHLLVVPRPGSTPDAEALRAWAGRHLDRYKLPDRIHFADALPLGGTGKADRRALRALLAAGTT